MFNEEDYRDNEKELNDSMEDLSSNTDSGTFDLNSFANMKVEEQPRSSKPAQSSKTKAKSKKKSSEKPTKKGKVLKVLLSCFLVCVITTCIILSTFLIYVFGIVDATIDEDLNDLSLNFTTTIYVKDKESGEYKEYRRLHGEFNRIWISYNRDKAIAKAEDYDGIPQTLADAFVAIEDKRFFDHKGIDWKRTFSAFANLFLNVYETQQGGSTITQQLVKNLTGDNSRSPLRKVREIMRARELEGSYSKETILECYMNTVAMGNGTYGVEVASNYYFGKSANELTLAECASLAAIVKGPSIYNPDKNPNDNKTRRGLVLGQMYEQGYITKEEYEAAKAEDIKIVANKAALNSESVNSYFVDALIDDVIDDIAEKFNYDKKHASLNFYNGGYKIYATVDMDVQNAVEEVFTNKKYIKTSSKTGKQLQGAITVMDYKGNIVGIAGGIGEKTHNRGLNRATSSPRQPGSSIKPISAYAPALENNLITYSSRVNDKKASYGKWTVKNAGGGYIGQTTVEYALRRSLNTIPVQLVNKMTPQASFDFLTEKLGIHNLDPKQDLNLSSLGMGGSYHGITTTEEAAAFQIFGNGGEYFEPTTYLYITDQHDKVIFDNREKEGILAISEETSVIMNHLLQNVIHAPRGTGAAAASYVTNMKTFGKTGTTDSTTNKWFVGGSPYYVASCWIGYDEAEEIADSSLSIKMWGDVMNRIHKGKKVKSFPESDYVTCRRYCTASGLVAKSSCPSTGVGWYKTSYMPTCNKHGGKVTGVYVAPTSSNTSSTSSVSSTPVSSQPSTSSDTVESSVSSDISQSDSSSESDITGSSSSDIETNAPVDSSSENTTTSQE